MSRGYSSPPHTPMTDPKISDLTVSQLRRLIRKTVQEAVAEVIIEFSIAAELQEEIELEAEMNHYIRSTLHGLSPEEALNNTRRDD